MDKEFAEMIKYAVGGIPVNDDTLLVDVIHELGPAKDYLAHDNTFEHMRIQSKPEVMDRQVRGTWEAVGKRDLYQVALEKARHIMATHEPEPLKEGAADMLREIVSEAEKELGVA